MNLLISRYILEVMEDSTLFRRFENGSWYPNIDDYRLFCHKQEKNNMSFAKTIERYHLIKKTDDIIETVMSTELDSIIDCLSCDGKKITAGYGTIYLNDEQIPEYELNTNITYISNGFYHHTEEFALQRLNNGSFVVGVCDNPSSIFYKTNEEKLRSFEHQLRKRRIPYKCYSHKNHRDKCLLLAYRSDCL